MLNNSPATCCGDPIPGVATLMVAGVGLGVSDELGDGLGRERRVHRHDVGYPANTADGSDVAAEIKAELVVERCIDGIRDRDEQQRVAVGRSIHHRCGSNIAGRSGAVLDHEALPEPLRQPLSDQSAEDVIAATRRIANDDAHRSRRIGLRPRTPQHGRQRGSARGQMQKISAGKFHRRPSISRRFIRSPRRRAFTKAGSRPQPRLRVPEF